MVHLQSFWQLAHHAGEPHTIIRVRNLQTVLPVGTDAWGRPNKAQPVLISASVSLSQPFVEASETDTVTQSTVHYGILSKAVLAACEEFRELLDVRGVGEGGQTTDGSAVPMHLRALVHYLHFYLTGEETLPKVQCQTLAAAPASPPLTRAPPVLSGQALRMLEIEIMLPKASLLGSGVSLKGCFVHDERYRGPSAYSMALTLHELRVPTIIGVNGNERLAKQMVFATVEMDRYDRMVDAYCRLEELVVKSISESTFQTLEALAIHISNNIIKYFLIPHFPEHIKADCLEGKGGHNHQRMRISLEKPTAVTFADAPVVEVLVDSDPTKNKHVNDLWQFKRRQPPFPLKGTLESWERETEDMGWVEALG